MRRVRLNDGISFYRMLQSIESEAHRFSNPVRNHSYSDYQDWLQKCQLESQPDFGDAVIVPQTTFWLLADNRPVGIGRIRHRLTKKLRKNGGNLAYAVSKSDRGQGYGSRLLELLLEEAAKMGLISVLITVHRDNIASQKIVLKNAGQLVDTAGEMRIYRIELG
ncbi:MAG: GNAT family N-acetyltransferase [Lentilactobacillus diolivorans]|uniref:GNAT family N-acetyltransferase n=1 Tax=Lentilactobacillus diolivorans TaxID=179838 RepID=UPI0039EC0943